MSAAQTPQKSAFISEDEILTYISGILHKNIIPKIVQTFQHDTYSFM